MFLTRSAIARRNGIAQSHLNRLSTRPGFPKPVSKGRMSNAPLFDEKEVLEWVADNRRPVGRPRKPTKAQKYRLIEDRYGEDIADAIYYAVCLFENPHIADGGEAAGQDWSLYHFLLAAGNSQKRARHLVQTIERNREKK